MSLGKPTPRQKLALQKRALLLLKMNHMGETGRGHLAGCLCPWYACVGCFSGVRPAGQGSDYCDRCGGRGGAHA